MTHTHILYLLWILFLFVTATISLMLYLIGRKVVK